MHGNPKLSAKSEHVVVIGGGVIGAMSAWYLVKSGCQVTIVEQNEFGKACSHGNCGYIAPSHILPLPQPGAIKKTMAAMLKSNSPFAIKPRFSSSFVSWFWNFSRRCNHRDMMSAAEGRHQLLQESNRLYEDLLEVDKIECERQTKGLLFVYDTVDDFKEFEATNRLMEENFSVSAKAYTPEQLQEIEPALKSGFGGAWHFECDSHIRPDKLMQSMKTRLLEAGVEIRESTKFERFRNSSSSVIGAETSSGEIEADRFVVCTGAWTPFLNHELGCKIPIEPGKGYSITMPCPDPMPVYPIIFEQSHVAITPMKSGYRIGSTMEFVGYDESINPKRLGLLRTAAEKYLKQPYAEPVEEEWYGWRPMTWDGKPVIDRSPRFDNVWVAAGHNMLGLSMGTGTGKLVRDLVLGDEPTIDASHFAVSRFN